MRLRNVVIGVFFFFLQYSLYGQIDVIKVRKEEPQRIYIVNEQMASFKGGITALITFFQANIQLPKEALDNGIMGSVFVSFTITETGDVSDIKIIKGIGYGCDDEVIRVVKLMNGRWNPQVKDNKPVKSAAFTFPVVFK